jgi:hypothetical protein
MKSTGDARRALPGRATMMVTVDIKMKFLDTIPTRVARLEGSMSMERATTLVMVMSTREKISTATMVITLLN